MLCGSCAHRWTVDLEWLDRWTQSQEFCPGCGINGEYESSPKETHDPCDPLVAGDAVASVYSYHRSTHVDWPSTTYDPTAALDNETRQRMGGDASVARWAHRQRSKALHVGTYEAAMENMLRRIQDQGDRGRQFYLYRVGLRADITVRSEVLDEPVGLMGDVPLTEVCPPGVDVARYLNRHEDAGSLSLALGSDALEWTQQASIPMTCAGESAEIDRLVNALAHPPVVMPTPPPFRSVRWRPPSAVEVSCAELAHELARGLPIHLRSGVESAIQLRDYATFDAPAWVRYAVGLLQLITQPEQALTALDTAKRNVM